MRPVAGSRYRICDASGILGTTRSALGWNPSFSSVFVYEFEAGSFFNPNSRMTPRTSSGKRVGAYRPVFWRHLVDGDRAQD
jgi:hypothetical protein